MSAENPDQTVYFQKTEAPSIIRPSEEATLHFIRIEQCKKIWKVLYMASIALAFIDEKDITDFPDLRKMIHGVLMQIESYKEGIATMIAMRQIALDKILMHPTVERNPKAPLEDLE